MPNQPIYDLKDTWSSAGTTFAGIKMNVADSASAAGSKLIELEINGEDMFVVDKLGNLVASGAGKLKGLELANDLDIAHGGTGASTAVAARNNLGVTQAIADAVAALRGSAPAEYDTLAELLQLVQANEQAAAGLYYRRDGSSGIVQIGTANANNGAVRLARRTTGFTSSIEFLDGDGAVAGLMTRAENSGIPFVLLRVGDAARDTIRVFTDSIQLFFSGAYRAVWHTGTAPEVTDAEADAGTGTVARMWTPARLWRAARAALPLVTQAIAEAGTDTVARSWSALSVWQAIRAALPLPSNAEVDAGTATAPRSINASLLFRAARAALPAATQALAEAGTDTVDRSWSVLRVWQSIRAALPLPSAAEIDAGTETAFRSINAALLFRAARAALVEQLAGKEPLRAEVTQAEAEAGTDTVTRSFSVLRVWQAIRAAIPTATDAEISAGAVNAPRALTMPGLWRGVRAVIANDKELAVDFYNGARLNGISSIALDMPAGFTKYRIEFGGLRLQSGTALMTLRNGPAGGALNDAADSYSAQVIQRRGVNSDLSNGLNNAFVVTALGTAADQYGEIIIDDQPGQFWCADAKFKGRDPANDVVLSLRSVLYVPGANPAGGRWGRIGLMFGGPLANAGYVRIFGVRA